MRPAPIRTAVAALLLAAAAGLARADAAPTRPHTFRYTPAAGSPEVPVSVVGDFNGWSATATPMTRGPDGDYTATVDVPAGLHHYKFVVDNRWMADPKGGRVGQLDDGFGDVSSGLLLAAEGSDSHKFTYAPPAGKSPAAVGLAGDFNGWSPTLNPMTKNADGTFTATVPVTPGKHQYKFVIDGTWLPDPKADPKYDADDGNGGHNSGFDAAAPGAAVADTPAATATHEFTYAPAAGPSPKAVDVAGDFNGWSTTATPMTKAADGTFTAAVPVTPGKHQYKFVVDGNWTPDPKGDPKQDADDGNGGKNSGFDTADAAATPPAKPAATPPAAAAAGTHTFTYAPPGGGTPTAVFLAGDFNGWSTTATPMAKAADGTFTATVPVPPGAHQYKYVVDGAWTNDVNSDPKLDADDGNQGHNSGFVQPAAKP